MPLPSSSVLPSSGAARVALADLCQLGPLGEPFGVGVQMSSLRCPPLLPQMCWHRRCWTFVLASGALLGSCWCQGCTWAPADVGGALGRPLAGWSHHISHLLWGRGWWVDRLKLHQVLKWTVLVCFLGIVTLLGVGVQLVLFVTCCLS